MSYYDYYIDGAKVNQYLFEPPNITLSADSEINAFVIEPSSISFRFHKIPTLESLLVDKTTYCTIKKNNVIIWTGYYDPESYTYSDGLSIVKVRFIPDISMMKEEKGLSEDNLTVKEHLDYLVTQNNFINSYNNSIFDGNYLKKTCSLPTIAPYVPTSNTLVHTPSLFTGHDIDLVINAVREKYFSTVHYRRYYGGIYFEDYGDSPISQTYDDLPGLTTAVQYFGTVDGHYADNYDDPTGETWKIFFNPEDDRIWAWGNHALLKYLEISNFEDLSHGSFILDLCYFGEMTANVINKELVFLNSNSAYSYVGKTFKHQHSRIELESNYELKMETDSNAIGDIIDMKERFDKYLKKKYLSISLFTKHSITIPDADNLIVPIGVTFQLNGVSVGKITSVVYQQKSNTIKITTIEK